MARVCERMSDDRSVCLNTLAPSPAAQLRDASWIDAPHLLLEREPDACRDAVKAFLAGL